MNSKAENSREVKVPESLPWEDRVDAICGDVTPRSARIIAKMTIRDDEWTQRDVDECNYLIHAANHYPALVEALERIVAEAGQQWNWDKSQSAIEIMKSSINDAREVLKQCKVGA